VIVQFQYQGQSGILNGLRETQVGFATNTLRELAFFKGVLGQPVVFREALAALHQVVVSDLKYKPRDRFAFRTWLEQQDQQFLASLGFKTKDALEKIEKLSEKLRELDRLREHRMKLFYDAREQYFQYVLQHEYEANYLFDPVITVHPDEISFEAFSKDESSYARLAAKYSLFDKIDSFECGTTNIDFSAKLARELERMRTYRRTTFDIAASGFTVTTTGAGSHKEKKIDLPESWVQGFHQVHSVMSLGLTRIHLDPMDLFNLLRFLHSHKVKRSPRALRFELQPNQRVKAVIEPWEHVIEFSERSVFEGAKPMSVRTWGRERLKVLARLIPIAKSIDLYLAGFGLPSIYVLDLGELTFTLALSGWTDNDWTGAGSAKFDLLSRRLSIGPSEVMSIYETLKKVRFSTDISLSNETGLGLEKTRSGLSYLCQVGRGMYDLGGKVYRHRELFADPFTVKEAAKVTNTSKVEDQTPQAKAARQIFVKGDVFLTARRKVSTGYKLSGSAKGADGLRVRPLLSLDLDGQVTEATCSCNYYQAHGLTKGPCEHILSLRLAHMAKLETEDAKGGN